MSKILANEIANYGDNAPIDLKEGLNIPAGKPIQAAGIAGTSGQVLSSTGTSINWITPFDGDYTSLTNRPTIPAAQVNADWNASSGVAVILNKPTVPPLTSLVVNSAGTPSLTFNGGNGQFTYTPPDLSNYDTAFGWGDHAQAGYLTAEVDTVSTVFGRSVSSQDWIAGPADAVSYYGKLITGQQIITNDTYFYGIGDAFYMHGECNGLVYLDRDNADDALPYNRGSNANSKVSADYFIRFSGVGASSQTKYGISHTVDSVMHHDVFTNSAGNPITYSIGNDAGIIRLGNQASTLSYLEASSQTTRLFGLGNCVLETGNETVYLPAGTALITEGTAWYNNRYPTAANLPPAGTYSGMFATLNDGTALFSHDADGGTTITVTVGVDTVGGQATGVFYFDGVEKPGSYSIKRGAKYIFDQSNATNATYGGVHHPLMFSTTLDGELAGGSHYMIGVTYKLDGVTKTMAEYVSGFTSASSRIVEWVPVAAAPNTLYYWCHFHTGQGNSFAVNNNAWVELLDENSTLGDLAGVDLSTPPTTGQVLKYDGNNWVAGPDNAGSGGTGIALTDISVTTATAGSAALSYNNVSGVFTYTPPNLSGYLTTETDPVFTASAAAGIQSSNISNWDTAYGWGNHASAGYLTSETSHSDVVVDGDFTSAGLMSRGGSSGTYSIVTDNSNNWNTAYGWGNHASAGYLTSYTVTASDLNSISITALSDVNTAGASVNDVLKWTGSAWTAQAESGGGGGANVTISDTAPGGPSTGDLWWESDKGRLKIYYQDTDSSQWVDATPPLAPALSSNAPATASSAGSEGDIRFDSGYVYVCIATNTWKRAALTTW